MKIEYELNKLEKGLFGLFKKKHNEHPIGTCDGGQYSYRITPSSIGTTITVICNECGEEKNITDFSDW